MAQEYFIQINNKQEGPFSRDEIIRKNLRADTLIWYDELEEWTEVSKIAEFRDKKPPPISSSKPKKNGTSFWRYLQIAAFLFLSVLGYLAYENWAKSNSSFAIGYQTYQEKVMSVAETEEMYPTRFLDASGTYRENLLGDRLKVNGTIKSSATVARYKDVTVRVTYYSKTKTNLGSEDYTIYEVLNPGRSTPFKLKIKNYRNVNSIGWDVVDAEVY